MAYFPKAPDRKGSIHFNPVMNRYEIYDGVKWVEMKDVSAGGVSMGTRLTDFDPNGTYKDQYYTDSTTKPRITNNISNNNKFTVRTTSGDVTADLETGDLTLPFGMSRIDGLREFWLAFQEHFKGDNSAMYEKEIKKLENEIVGYRMERNSLERYGKDELKKHLASKIRSKYGSEKFIMMKPDDLLKFLELEDEK